MPVELAAPDVMTCYGILIAMAGDYTLWFDEDEEDAPYLTYDGDMDCVDQTDTQEQAIEELGRLDRAAAIETAREAIQEVIDEADDDDTQDTLDRLVAAMAILRPKTEEERDR